MPLPRADNTKHTTRNTFLSCRKESIHAPQNPLQGNGQEYSSDVFAVWVCQFAAGSPVAMCC